MLIIFLSASALVALVVVLIFGLAKLLVRWYSPSSYYEYNPDKMVLYLEKRYNIDFPDDIREIKAAKSGMMWDGWSGFILKFTAQPS